MSGTRFLTAKLAPRSSLGVFIGYDQATKGYRIYLSKLHCVIVSKDILFDETLFYYPSLISPPTSHTPSAVQFVFEPLSDLPCLSAPAPNPVSPSSLPRSLLSPLLSPLTLAPPSTSVPASPPSGSPSL
jgi:hypothetical protein